jgi:hypothetical protein
MQALPPTPATATATQAPALPGRPGATPSDIYQAYRAQRRELTNQLDELESTRTSIMSQLEDLSADDVARKPLTDRLSEVDGRIATVDGMLASNASAISQAAGIPGAVVEPPRVVRNGPPEEVFVLGGIFMFVFLLPLSIAFARRIWRKSAVAITSLPRDLIDRLNRMEQAVEATSLEVERIGEGQRFLTRLFTEGESARALSAGAAVPLERKQAQTAKPLP